MKEISTLVGYINEEIHDSEKYAERYIDAKAHNNEYSSVWHRLSEEELHHADLVHEIAVEEISVLKRVYQPTAEMEEMWTKSHMEYVTKTEWIKKMLSM